MSEDASRERGTDNHLAFWSRIAMGTAIGLAVLAFCVLLEGLGRVDKSGEENDRINRLLETIYQHVSARWDLISS
jgi:hypothetical protein